MSTAPASDGAIRAVVGESPGHSYGRFSALAEAETIPASIPMFQPGESDTESMDGGAATPRQADISEDDGAEMGSVVSWQDEVIVLPDPDVEVMLPGAVVLREAFRSLDEVNLVDHFSRRPAVMKSVPKFLTGPFRNSLRVALDEATVGSSVEDLARQERGWKLFLLLPRMLLHRPPGGGLLSKEKLSDRFKMFSRGEWLQLLAASRACDEKAATARNRRRRRPPDDLERRAKRALQLVQMGELSSARQALEGAELHLIHTRLCKR